MEDKNVSSLVRPVGGRVLVKEEPNLVHLPITDDRNLDPAYSAWLCVGGCGKFYDSCECNQLQNNS